MLTDAQRLSTRRVIAVMNNKGGVGKTSVTANVAGVLAVSGKRVLVIDLDPQGNLGRDLGYRYEEGLDDEGKSLFDTLSAGVPLAPVRGIRDYSDEGRGRLDVIPGGRWTAMLADVLSGMAQRGADPSERLAEALAEIAGEYDLVLLDTPPGEANVQRQALIAARRILIPTIVDDGSLDGLGGLAARVVDVRSINPTLSVLGVVLFSLNSSAKRIEEQTRAELTVMLGDIAPVFAATIRQAQAAAVDARRRGQLVFEVAKDFNETRFNWTKELDDAEKGKGEPAARIAASSTGLAADYVNLTKQLLVHLVEQEQLEQGVTA